MGNAPKRIVTLAEAVRIVEHCPEVHLLIGYGSRIHYDNIDTVVADLRPLLDGVQARSGDKPWMLIYGGDKVNEGVPDVGLLVQRLATAYNCVVMAPCVSAEPDPVPQPFLNYYYVMEPEYEGDLPPRSAEPLPPVPPQQQPPPQQQEQKQAREDEQAEQQQQHSQRAHASAVGGETGAGDGVGVGGNGDGGDWEGGDGSDAGDVAGGSVRGGPTALGKRSFQNAALDGESGGSDGDAGDNRETLRQRLLEDATRQLQQPQPAPQEQELGPLSERAGDLPNEGLGERPPPPRNGGGSAAGADADVGVDAAQPASGDSADLPPPPPLPVSAEAEAAEPLLRPPAAAAAPEEARAAGQLAPMRPAALGAAGAAVGGRGAQLWGGIIGGQPVGPSRFLLHDELLGSDDGRRPRRLTSVIAAGGGPIALQELQYAAGRGVPWTYVRCRGRYPPPGICEFGPVDEWVREQGRQQQ
ncbi:hypothetical protein PLESTB_000000300 [Pleodorina starrii]|uniref:Uncharacterized protein n=1 Tax=Pleodorina starrii TaxID=330485 RepID=A0A9W6EX18_9CHLO|nr:hypothetical protein PLESTM_000349600 [Pleodorina starrii]GLC47551.1 hypothetical protein PLESTB_000000300 [Pleodorina starrii]GLC76842.1 hypothetical protein PLESTF_001847000 [Pleodorina starrii]